MRLLFHSHYHTPRLTELRHLYWAHGLAAMAVGLAGLLVPIYLLKLGYSLPEVVLFHLAIFGGGIPVLYLSTRLASRVNANWLMASAELSIAVFFALLLTLPWAHWPLWLPVLFRALDKGLYWPAYHLSFSKSRSRKKTGRQLGSMNALVILTHGSAPAIGGVIASQFGIAWVYGVAVGLMVVTAVVLLRTPNVVKHRPFDWRLLSRRIWPDLMANFFFSGFYLVEQLIWPLLIFFIVTSYAGVGLLSSVVVLTSAAVALYVGRSEDRGNPRRYLKRGSWVMAIGNASRTLVQTTGHVFGVNLFGGVGQSLLTTSMPARYYYHADREPRLEYVWAMETAHLAGWVLLLSILLVLSQTFPPKLAVEIMIAITVPFGLGVRLMR